jgi:RimJ/RimL family protein N-acetyltransferase
MPSETSSFAGHDIRLETPRLELRPFESSDFVTALPYYQDPQLRQFLEGNRDSLITLDYLERAGEYMAHRGYLFAIVERETQRAIGEACLEWMNLSRAQVRTGERVMRLPIGIWDRERWGQGLGREVVECLARYAFDQLGIDRLCAMDVDASNVRSRRLWESLGMRPVDSKPDETQDFEITSAEWMNRRR